MAWYPKQTEKKGEQVCPVCGGKGTRRDAKTGMQRVCVLCKGDGVVKQKGNAVVKYMSKYDMDRIINVIDQTNR